MLKTIFMLKTKSLGPRTTYYALGSAVVLVAPLVIIVFLDSAGIVESDIADLIRNFLGSLFR